MFDTRNITCWAAFLIVAAVSIAFAQENPCSEGMTRFYIDDPQLQNSVTFRSEAPLEEIVGTSNDVTGTLCFDPTTPSAGGSGHIQVPVATLQSGIPLRDEDMRSKEWLNAKEYPYIEFEITNVKDVKEIKSGEGSASYDVTAVGDFSVHGRTKELEVPARITYLRESAQTQQRREGDLLAARAAFKIVLADFEITGPSGKKLIGSKVGKEIEIEINLVAASVNPIPFDGP